MRGIYKITNGANGKCYIGKSEDLAKRLKSHINSLRGGWNRNKHLQNAYNLYRDKYGFTIEILEYLDDDEDINEREKYWISYYKSNDSNYGYNRTSGGDGGNSYVDCMTEEEREEHDRKHREIRTGENSHAYGKHLYTDGIEQRYLSDDEIECYVNQGWKPGANNLFKEKCRQRSLGENNPFYGKKHSQETIDKILRTKEEIGFTQKGTKIYHKDGKAIHIQSNEVEEYEKKGWSPGYGNAEMGRKSSETKHSHFSDPEWKHEFLKKRGIHYVYKGKDFYGQESLLDYLHNNGYPTISKSTIQKIRTGKKSKYEDLLKQIQIIEKEK